MRRIWTILSVLAIGNLVALVGLVGWLGASGRLSVDRVRSMREMLGETAEAQAAREKSNAEEAEASAEGDDRGVALSSAELMEMRLDGIEADRERRRRLAQEARDLGASLAQRESALQRDREALATEREAYEEYLASIAQTDGDAQFRKAVKVLDGLKAQDAAGIITALIESGKDGLMDGEEGSEGAEDAADAPGLRMGGVDRAVSYVNAMQERSRLKLMAELSADRPELAADLLERLRSRGIAAAQTP